MKRVTGARARACVRVRACARKDIHIYISWLQDIDIDIYVYYQYFRL